MKPFLSDRSRITPPAVHQHFSAKVGAFTNGVAAPAASGEDHHAIPQIECVREGDRVTRLIVVCGCGERIEIDCLYGPGK